MCSSSAYQALTAAQRRFVDLLVQGESGAAAVRQVRPRIRNAAVLASRWRALPLVRQAIEERGEEAMEDAGITSAQVLLAIARIANLDVRELCHPDGRPKALHELDGEIARALQGLEVEEIGALTRTKFKLAPRIEALKLLGQRLRLFPHSHELAGPGGAPIPVARHELTDEQLTAIIMAGQRPEET